MRKLHKSRAAVIVRSLITSPCAAACFAILVVLSVFASIYCLYLFNLYLLVPRVQRWLPSMDYSSMHENAIGWCGIEIYGLSLCFCCYYMFTLCYDEVIKKDGCSRAIKHFSFVMCCVVGILILFCCVLYFNV